MDQQELEIMKSLNLCMKMPLSDRKQLYVCR